MLGILAWIIDGRLDGLSEEFLRGKFAENQFCQKRFSEIVNNFQIMKFADIQNLKAQEEAAPTQASPTTRATNMPTKQQLKKEVIQRIIS